MSYLFRDTKCTSPSSLWGNCPEIRSSEKRVPWHHWHLGHKVELGPSSKIQKQRSSNKKLISGLAHVRFFREFCICHSRGHADGILRDAEGQRRVWWGIQVGLRFKSSTGRLGSSRFCKMCNQRVLILLSWVFSNSAVISTGKLS
jgi:hypothetical protein